jgi:sugar lactone lactonase YvrE
MAATHPLLQRPARVFADGTLTDPQLDHPEGIAVHPRDASVWCGGERGQVFRVDADGSIEQVADTGGFCLGLAFDAGGRLFVCDLKHAAVLCVDAAGRVDRFADGAGGHRIKAPNHLCFDADGLLYVSDCRGQGDPGAGLFRFAPDGAGELWTDAPLNFANGLALEPDGSALCVAETWARRVLRVPIGPGGAAGEPEVLVELPGTLPDGLAFAADGALYVALYQPSRIVRVERDGSVGVVAEDPDAHVLCHPTNIAFKGRELLAANLGRWHVTAIDAGVGGAPLPPRRPA